MPAAKPIVKWAGGKSRLLRDLLHRVPTKMRTFAEPFAGGAALFFAVASSEGLTFKRALLADQNAELLACYRAVRDDVDGVIVALGAYHYDRDLFYETRKKSTAKLSDVDRAARFIFLNRTCFNGLWRVNASGKFNVPFGRYKNPRILDVDGLRAASAALRGVEIVQKDFAEVTRKLGKNDFVYLDPPYAPVSKTAAFTAYASGGFGPADQRRLVDELRGLRRRGAMAMVSNADTPETRELYREFACEVVAVSRPINSDATKRGDAAELIVTSWGSPGISRRSLEGVAHRATYARPS